MVVLMNPDAIIAVISSVRGHAYRFITRELELHGMKGLRLLVLPEGSPDEIRKLGDALPTCSVVPGGELCLGSGWILALFPAAALAALILRRRGARSTERNA